MINGIKKVIRLIDWLIGCYLKPTLTIFLKLYRDMNTFYKKYFPELHDR